MIKGLHHNSDHHFVHSISFRDPNGDVIELTAKLPNHEDATNPAKERRGASSIAGSKASSPGTEAASE